MLVPKVARRFDRVGSTNAALLQALRDKEPLPSGAVFVTDAQTAGRGQGDRFWHATPGDNLTLSMLFEPEDLSVDRIFALTEAAALAVADCVATCAPRARVRIKWPNDVYVADRKIAGILIQNGLRGSRVQWSVIGIGLNVAEAAFPPELQSTATTLTEWAGANLRPDIVLPLLLDALGRQFSRIGRAELPGLRQDYLSRLYLMSQEHTFRRLADGERFRATVAGVDVEGRLLLIHSNGRREAFELRSLSYR